MDVATSAQFSEAVAEFAAAARDGRLLQLPTSGTTRGIARTVLRTARSWTDSFSAVSHLTGLTTTSRICLPGPSSSTMNLFAAAHADWAGARLVDTVDDATHVHLTPSRLAALLDAPPDLTGKLLVVAGDTLSPALRRRAEQAGARVAHYYGAAELSFVAWGTDADHLHAFPGVEIEVRDEEIWVRSGYLAEGYLEGADGPLRRAADGFATVGDRGRLDGPRLVVDGRPGAILTGGATVLVADVEAAIRPALRGQVAVVGLPHPRFGKIVAAALTDEADLEPARRAARGLGAGRPRRWFHRRHLPLTAAGKVDRRALATELSALEVALPLTADNSVAREGVEGKGGA